jgi:hypothetical protein
VTLLVAPLAVVAATAAVVIRLGSAGATADGRGPTVTFLTPADGAHLPLGPIEVTARVEDPDGVEYVELNVDDVQVTRTQVAALPTTTVTFMWRSEQPRVHQLALRAGDVHGASGEVRHLRVTVGPDHPDERQSRLHTLATMTPPQHAARKALDLTPATTATTAPPAPTAVPTSPPTSIDPPTGDLTPTIVRRAAPRRPSRSPAVAVTTPPTVPNPTPVPEPAVAPVAPVVPPAPPAPTVTVLPPPTTVTPLPTDDGRGKRGKKHDGRDGRRDGDGRGDDDGAAAP